MGTCLLVSVLICSTAPLIVTARRWWRSTRYRVVATPPSITSAQIAVFFPVVMTEALSYDAYCASSVCPASSYHSELGSPAAARSSKILKMQIDGPHTPAHLSRRDWLQRMAALGLLGALSPHEIFSILNQAALPAPSATGPFSPQDDALLEEIEKANFQYFWEQSGSQTGLIKDRSKAFDKDTRVVASIAATGFGLTALCIGEHRGYVSRRDARDRVLLTLRFLWKKMPTHRGFYYHFADINTGERTWDSEVSSVDTAMLLCGILACRRYFEEHSEISLLAYQIFNRVDWTWLSEDTSLLPHGWTPEVGFLPYRWDYYSELMMMYLLGLGSLTHPLPVEAWNAWKRINFEFDGISYIGSFAPLFVHQYSQAWFDFRGKRDKYADYFENSAKATEAHRRFCLQLARQFPDYSDDLWGITA